jgi:hypothetical protein
MRPKPPQRPFSVRNTPNPRAFPDRLFRFSAQPIFAITPNHNKSLPPSKTYHRYQPKCPPTDNCGTARPQSQVSSAIALAKAEALASARSNASSPTVSNQTWRVNTSPALFLLSLTPRLQPGVLSPHQLFHGFNRSAVQSENLKLHHSLGDGGKLPLQSFQRFSTGRSRKTSSFAPLRLRVSAVNPFRPPVHPRLTKSHAF